RPCVPVACLRPDRLRPSRLSRVFQQCDNDQCFPDPCDGFLYINLANSARVTAPGFAIRMTLFFELVPETNVIAAGETLNLFARNLTSSRFAAPSTGGAATRTRSVPSCRPATSLRDARGTTRTAKVTPFE